MALQGEYEPNPQGWVAQHIEEMERTGTVENPPYGRPIVIITFRGRKSGKLRKTGVMRVEHDGAYALVASKGGAPEHPTWYLNLVDDPVIDVQDGFEKQTMRVRELSGDERAVWWDRSVEAYPPYAEYQTKTDRLIPVLLAEPAE
ncbi:deazaflavin-dependent oxidoreductase (nitroreductase family) [Mumia flava]|uniref:Deazaflavin-dependent oxidoreductase (Nitroreductase family) n=1 Tax=Mumia flava TaxID=1348852 RepID=A0A0B2BNW3_9ACTN|nr:nitroreductase family deazaflavin-dependent oxidoreductase [Mumia flava]PJJ57283.1 deazaflavin-dependent oxidoreductase (nitroreductase family) [Mumia flava]